MVALPRSFGAPLTIVNAEPSSKSCRNNVAYLPDVEWLTGDVKAVTALARMIEALLVRFTENSRCEIIAEQLGYTSRSGLKLSLNVVRDVLRSKTKSVDSRIGFALIAMCYQLDIDPWIVAGNPQMSALLDAHYVAKAIAEGRVTPVKQAGASK
jgi:hypothetical protein